MAPPTTIQRPLTRAEQLGIRASRLRVQGYEDYAQYLRSRHWRDVRGRYWRSDDLPKACICGGDAVLLHHKTYERVGAERLTDLMPMCATCHEDVHLLYANNLIGLDAAGLVDRTRSTRPEIQLTRHDLLLERVSAWRDLPLAERLRRLQEQATDMRISTGSWRRATAYRVERLRDRATVARVLGNLANTIETNLLEAAKQPHER